MEREKRNINLFYYEIAVFLFYFIYMVSEKQIQLNSSNRLKHNINFKLQIPTILVMVEL